MEIPVSTENSGTLNVILHGGITFIDRGGGSLPIKAYLPNNPNHVFRAGNWLGETDLARGDYQLFGADPGTGEFKRSKNLILKPPQQEPKGVYATLSFPRPEDIASLRVATVPRKEFVLDKQPLSEQEAEKLHIRQEEHLSMVQVLTYKVPDANELCIRYLEDDKTGGHYWEPVFLGNYINLHVFCSEDRFSTPTHAVEDFAACTELLGYPGLTLSRPQPAGAIPDDSHLPEGVIEEETEDLGFRTLRMARLGRLFKQNGDTNLAWAPNSALWDPYSCSGVIGAPPAG
jgi:hypothetical protein